MQLGGVDKGSGSGGGEEREGEKSVVEKLFGCEVETVSVCRCGWSASRKSTELLFSLSYPPGEASYMQPLQLSGAPTLHFCSHRGPEGGVWAGAGEQHVPAAAGARLV